MYGDGLNQRSLIFLLLAIGLISLPHAWHVPLPIVVLFNGTLCWRLAGTWRPAWLPNRWVLLAVTVLGVGVLLSQRQGLFGQEAGTAVIMVALGLKLLEIRGKREVYLIVFLAFIVAATQFLYEQSMLMAAYIGVVCVALLSTLITQNSIQIATRAALKNAGLILVQALPLAVVVFVLFPRLEAPRWMWLQDDRQALSGLSDTLEPGSISQLSLSDDRVFRVRFDGALPPPNQRYWRGPVYMQTDGVRWSIAANPQQTQAKPSFGGETYRYTLLMEPQKENWIFALDMPESFDESLQLNSNYQLVTLKTQTQRNEYHIVSRPIYNTGKLNAEDYQQALQLPAAASAKQLALVRALGGFQLSPQQFIQNLLQHFRQEAFYYTLTPPLMLDDPIDTFLFETRSGFCSHYATAFVYLSRIANIPARVVGGYQGGEFNKVGNFLEVRQADAHAWAEVWLPEQGWLRVDPTAAVAPERVERGVNVDLQIASGAVRFSPLFNDAKDVDWLKRSRQLWQSLDYHWQRWVINYHGVSQRQFLQKLGIEGLLSWLNSLIVSLVLITVPMAVWLLRRQTRKTTRSVKYYQQFCAKLAKVGIERGVGEGPVSFAARAVGRLPDLAVEIERITEIFVRLQYRPYAETSDLQDLKTLVGKFRI